MLLLFIDCSTLLLAQVISGVCCRIKVYYPNYVRNSRQIQRHMWRIPIYFVYGSLQWRHDGRNGVSNHQPHGWLLSRLFRRRSKKTSKLCVTGLCAGNSPVTGEFPAQMASNAENVSIWLRHHVRCLRWHLRKVNFYTLTHLPPGQNGRHFANDVFRCIYCEWNVLYYDSNFSDICSQGCNQQ